MKITINNIFIFIEDINTRLTASLKNMFTLKDTRSCFVKCGFEVKFDKDKAEKVEYFIKTEKGIFIFTGLLPELLVFIKDLNLKPTIIDKREKLPYQKKEFTYEEIRKEFNPNFAYVDHQVRSLQKMLTVSKGIIKATTSAGKGDMILAFCRITGLKTLVLVNNKTLAIQLYERFSKGGLDIDIRTSGRMRKIKPDFSYVATVGVAKDLPNDFDVIIIDECHRASSSTYQDFLSQTKAKAIYGFSATPEGNAKVDFMKVKQFTGGIIETIEAEELLEHEVISYPNIHMVKHMCEDTLNWEQANELYIVNSLRRNSLIQEITEKYNEPTLILVRNIEHGKKLQSLIQGSVFVSGGCDNEKRKEAIQGLEDGSVRVVIATNIFNEGISINAVKVLIIASGGKSRIETTQKLGRALRRSEGKTEALIFDFYDENNEILQRHSEERIKIYKKIGFPVVFVDSI